MSDVNEVLDRLSGVRETPNGWAAQCPVCGDHERQEHLTIGEGDGGKVLLTCQKGRHPFWEIMEEIGLPVGNQFPQGWKKGQRTGYRVRDANGTHLATHGRTDNQNGGKHVDWRTAKGKGLQGMRTSSLPLYGAEAVGSVKPDEPIVVTEGEKAAEALTRNGIPALGTVTGAAGTPGEKPLGVLANRIVVLWPDNDDEGKAHMERIGSALRPTAREVRVFDWPDAPEKGDAADHPALLRGEGIETLRSDLRIAPVLPEPRDDTVASQVDWLREDVLRWVHGKSGDIDGLRTGIPSLDQPLLGLQNGRSYVIAAEPGGGKSLLCGQIGLAVAQQGVRVLLHSIESMALEYVQRLVCRMAQVPYMDAMEHNIDHEQRTALFEAYEDLAQLPFLMTELSTQTPEYIRAQVELHKPGLLIVDYAQFVTPDDPSGNNTADLDEISGKLAAIKGDFKIPVILAAQPNREYRTMNQEPQMHHLRGSGRFEADSDAVIFLHRPQKKNDAGEWEYVNEQEVQVICPKNRAVRPFRTTLYFEQDQNWLTDKRRMTW